MNDLENFTQRAYLETAAVQPDSEIVDLPHLAFVKCTSIKERWTNAVVRATQSAAEFSLLAELVDAYDAEQINFNWHVWELSSHPDLQAYLIKEHRLALMGGGTAFFKRLDEPVPQPAQDTDAGLFKLDSTFLNSYVSAKIHAWNIDRQWESRLREIGAAQISDPARVIYVVIKDSAVIAGAGAYVQGSLAYLRGSFCQLEYRGLGFYKKLVQYREADLYRRGVRTLTTLADGATSAPVLQRLGYESFSKFTILARKPSPWVSL